MGRPDPLSRSVARRIAVHASGLGQTPPTGPGGRAVRGVIQRLGQLQIDSVNVYERAHYLPLFSRLGAVPRAALDDLAGVHTIEYWPHQAGIISAADWPLWQWRRDAFAESLRGEWVHEHRELCDWLRAELASNGPMTSGQIEHDQNRSRGAWWGWSDVKIALEYLWRMGEVVCLRRNAFERVYELPSTLPRSATERTLDAGSQVRELLERAGRALGVFTEADLTDYWRMPAALVRPALQSLVDDGSFAAVTVEGWTTKAGRPLAAWRHRDARAPRRVDASTIVSPFDPLVWFRPRAERLFDFSYRIEIYTPAQKRQYGYYSLPVLLDDQVVARVDLKSSRKERTLLVQSTWAEAHAPNDLPERLLPVLEAAARWQSLERIETRPIGNVAHLLPELVELD